MTQISIDPGTSAKLLTLKAPAVLCDPTTGRVLGRFIPEFDPSEWELVSGGASEEELDRREASNERRFTTVEVLSHLENLPCSESNGCNQP